MLFPLFWAFEKVAQALVIGIARHYIDTRLSASLLNGNYNNIHSILLDICVQQMPFVKNRNCISFLILPLHLLLCYHRCSLITMPRKATTAASTAANRDRDPAPKRGAKRKSTDQDSTTTAEGGKRAKTSEPAAPEVSEEEKEQQRPRLTTPDLEFDYDKSQLRDPRPTPGRVRRPRLEERELTSDFKQRFSVPVPEPVARKGISRAAQKELLCTEQALLDPSATSHDLYVCHKKGPRGGPTCDPAGFKLDYDKVAEWMKPKRYSKSRMVGGTARGLARGAREQREVFDCFFVAGDEPDANTALTAQDYVKDHISKDLGVPWHQIGPKQACEWQEKGFEKKKFSEWWREPNAEERRRMLKMLAGGSLRADL
ncbi:hypothetical protein F5B21DRAFT_497612 [Xylaria acuta]|nr:hypothetical protein F5B21DRAFT_497612 [Xylaria acuta]